MGRWLAAFDDNSQKTVPCSTDNTDNTRVMAVMAVRDMLVSEKNRVKTDNRWYPEIATEGYVWCLDCTHWNGQTCVHTDNPFRKQQPLAPRKCQWYQEA